MNDFKGVHHFYLGLVFVLVGFFLIWVHWIPSTILMVSGTVMLWDDFYQHTRKRKEPEYQSPLHRLFSLFYRFEIVRKITGFFDRIFGR